MLYLHGLGTFLISCTPLSWKGAECVLFVGHLGWEPAVPAGSAGFPRDVRILAKPGSSPVIDLGFWP